MNLILQEEYKTATLKGEVPYDDPTRLYFKDMHKTAAAARTRLLSSPRNELRPNPNTDEVYEEGTKVRRSMASWQLETQDIERAMTEVTVGEVIKAARNLCISGDAEKFEHATQDLKDFGVYCCNTVPRISENNARTHAERHTMWYASKGKEYDPGDRTAAYNLHKSLAKEIMRQRQLAVCHDRIDVNADPKRILVCLTHINNVTEDMIDQILKERLETGPFKDIKDLTTRIRGVGPVIATSLERYLIGFSGTKVR